MNLKDNRSKEEIKRNLKKSLASEEERKKLEKQDKIEELKEGLEEELDRESLRDHVDEKFYPGCYDDMEVDKRFRWGFELDEDGDISHYTENTYGSECFKKESYKVKSHHSIKNIKNMTLNSIESLIEDCRLQCRSGSEPGPWPYDFSKEDQ